MSDRGLNIKIRANASQFESAMSNIKKSVTNLSSSFAGKLGAALGIGFLIREMSQLTNQFDSIAKRSKALGLSTDDFQKIAYAAERSGSSVEGTAKAFKILQRNIYDAQVVGGEQLKTFEILGLDLKKLGELTPIEQFKETVAALDNIENATIKSALAQKVFGRSGNELIPMLTDLKSLMSEASEIGIVKSETLKAAEDLADRITDIKQALISMSSETGIFEKLASGLNALIESYKALKNELKGTELPEGFTKRSELVQKKEPWITSQGQAAIPSIGANGETIYSAFEDVLISRVPKKEEIANIIEKKLNTKKPLDLASIVNKDATEKIEKKLNESIEKAKDELALLEAKNDLSEEQFNIFKINLEYDKKISEAKDAELQSILRRQKMQELLSVEIERQKKINDEKESAQKEESQKVSEVKKELMLIKARKILSDRDFQILQTVLSTNEQLKDVKNQELADLIKQKGSAEISDIMNYSSKSVGDTGLQHSIYSIPIDYSKLESNKPKTQEQIRDYVREIVKSLTVIENKDQISTYR